MKKDLILLGMSLFLFFSLEFSWAQNSSELEAIQKAIKEKGLSWTAGETDISRMTEAEKRGMLGGLPPEPGSPERPREGIEKLAKLSMPSYFSWGNHNGYNWMTSIKNQGYCGSCWAFAACEDFEAVQKIRLYQPYREIDVSEQTIVSCWKGDCNDWNLDGTLESFKNNGTPDETCFPYVSGTGYVPPCANRCSDWLSRALFIDDWGRYDSPAVATIKGEIQNDGPVMTWMNVFTDFRDFYTGGVYVHTGGTSLGGHFVVLYGWDDGNNCWLAKNSWGTGWGETGPDGSGGWFRIRMGTNEVGCENWVYWLNPGPLPNVVHTTPSGWTYAVVPRNNNTATWTSCSITPTLTGNKDSTWINLAFMNDGSFIARDISSRAFIDAEWYALWHWLEWLNPGDSYDSNNVGAFNIRGGRHTICDSLDWDNTVFETDENDNVYLRQFVWSPYVLAENTPVDRGAPPWKGYLTYPNSDGFQFTRPTLYASGVGIIPHHASDDYDLNIYSDYSGSESGFSSLLKNSSFGGGYTDFVIGTYTSSPQTTYPAVIRYANNNAGFHIDATSSIGRHAIPPMTWTDHSLPAYRVLNVYEVELTEGECYEFHLDNTSGDANLGLAVYPARPGFYSKTAYQAGSNVNGPGEDESFYWTADTTEWFPLVVYKSTYADYDDTNTYTLTVTPPYITVTSPNGKEDWQVGQTYPITWTSSCFTGDVKLTYSTNNGANWITILASTSNDGSEPWVIPNTPSDSCLVKISDVTDDIPADTSDSVFAIGVTGVSETEEEKEFTFSLAQNFPNPFNPNTSIQFSLPVSGRVSLKIYNLSGQEVRTLIDEDKRKGEYEVLWDGKDNSGKNVASGIYFYHIRAKNFAETKKMVLLK
jgi:C1A family cysteine protease